MVSTHMRGTVIPTSVSKGFLRACTLRSVAYSSTLLLYISIMILENIWYKISEWFDNYGERTKLIKSFNNNAKDSFVRGETPTVLKASSSKGISQNRHSFSSLFNTGFRIQALSGRPLTKNEMILIGKVILSDKTLVRTLIILGWDTLEVHDNSSRYGCRWCLTDYANINMIEF